MSAGIMCPDEQLAQRGHAVEAIEVLRQRGSGWTRERYEAAVSELQLVEVPRV